MSTVGTRGKWAEGKVKDVLLKLETSDAKFTFNRVQDAHAAGGRFVAQAGDFQAFRFLNGVRRNFLIEIKEVAHDFRLSYNNFTGDKVARMWKRSLAGSECLVFVYHTTSKVWREVPFEVFLSRPITAGSWDLSTYPTGSISNLLQESLSASKEYTFDRGPI